MLKPYSVTLDIYDTETKGTKIVYYRDDTDVYPLTIELLKKGEPFNLSGVGQAKITFRKPDKNKVVGLCDIVDVENGIVSYNVQTQEISCPGLVKVEITLYGMSGERLTANNFWITVKDDLDDDDWVESQSEYPILTQLITQVNQTESNIETKEAQRQSAESTRQANETMRQNNESIRQSQEAARQASIADIENRFAQLETGQQQEAEVINARTSTVLGKTFTDLNSRLENTESKVFTPAYLVDSFTAQMKSLPDTVEKGQLSVTVKGLTATNLVKNGNFVKDSDGDEIADFWSAGGSNFTNPRIENNTQYWTPLLPNVHSSSLSTGIYFPNVYGHKYYIKAKTKNIGQVLWWGETTQRISTTGIPAKGLIFTSNLQATTRLTFYASEANVESYVSNVILVDLTAHGLEDKTVDELDAMFSHYFDGTKSTISALRLTSQDENEENQSYMYIKATDESNKIVNLNSLPNGVVDRIYQGTNGKWYLEKNIGISKDFSECEWKNMQEGHTDNFYAVYCNFTELNVDLAGKHLSEVSHKILNYTGNGGSNSEFLSTDDYFYRNNDLSKLQIKVPKSAYSGEWTLEETQEWFRQNDVKLNYQLAEPIIKPAEVDGELYAYPNGTVIVEPYHKEQHEYDEEVGLTFPYPIEKIEKIEQLVDGQLVELDFTATIAPDGLSATIDELIDGDIVTVYAPYKSENSTIPTTTITVPLNTNAQLQSNTKTLQAHTKKIMTLEDRLDLMYADLDFRLTVLEGV